MKVKIKIRDFKEIDQEEIRTIFNYYAKNSFAAYSEEDFSKSFVKKIAANAKILLILEADKKVAGFGYISPYKPFKNFDQTGMLTYFISPDYTGKGFGTKIFNMLIKKGKKLGITNYLAHISSKNEPSINFHKKHGFEEVGRFKNVAIKYGESIDIIWVQKQY